MTEGAQGDSLTRFLSLVGQFCDDLIGERNLSPATVRSYSSDLRSFALWCERNHVDPLECEHRTLRMFLADEDAARYERSTINRHLSSIKSFFKWAEVSGVLEGNPVSALRGPKRARPLPRVFTPGDMRSLLSVYQKDKTAVGLRNQAYIEFLYATGARISEASNLDMSWVNLNEASVRLLGKGRKERLVPLHATAVASLGAYLRDARPLLLAKCKGGAEKQEDSSHAFFLSSRGNRMSPGALRRVFDEAAAMAGLGPDFTPHVVRHTFASDLLVGGADLRSVQEMLGHSSLSTTQVYTHLSPERLQDVHHQAHPRG